ncbi:sensor histidine kinase [Ciceribacter sp. L1K23]|nr:sensor histidine kinase [Ciceribacter sp. L1K23]
MVGLALITTLPLAVFSLVIVGQSRNEELRALQLRAQQEADTYARMVERQFHDMTTTLMVLETSPELRTRDFADFHARATAALARSDWYMIVVDETGQQLLNTRVPRGQPLGKTSNMEALQDTLARDELVVSNLFFGRTSSQFVYNVMKRVELAQGEGRLVIILTQAAADMDRIIDGRKALEGWTYSIIDGADRMVASNTETAPGEPVPPQLLAAARTPLEDRLQRRGEMLGYSRIGLTEWQVLVEGPAGADDTIFASVLNTLVLAGLACFLLSLASAAIFGRKLRWAIDLVADRADGVGRGEIVSPLDTGIREIDEVSKALSNASFDRHQAEERLQLVLREMAHRTKNVILVAQSLVRQSARYSDDKESFVTAITGRLQSFAASLDRLLSEAATAPTFRDLAMVQLGSFVEGEERLTLDGPDFPVTMEAVKEIGMVLHELATNAMKYGAWSGPAGRVELSWTEEVLDGETRIRVLWRERGGPPPSGDARKGFGSLLIRSTIQSLRGTALGDYREDGVVWTMDLPADRIRAAGQTVS